MNTPDIAGLCKRLRGLSSPEAECVADGQRLTAFCHAGREAADTLERQAAENKRLRALLMLARPFVADDTEATCDLADRIDAALTGEDS
jgi:hypothetical protein